MTKYLLAVMLIVVTVCAWSGEASGQLRRFRERAARRSDEQPDPAANRRGRDLPRDQANNQRPRNLPPPTLPRPSYRPPINASRLPTPAVDADLSPTSEEFDTLPAPAQLTPVRPNSRPEFELIEPIDSETYTLAGEVIQGQAVAALEQITADLAAAASDPRVQNQLDVLKKHFDEGSVVAGENLDKLRDGAIDSGLLPVGIGGMLPSAVERRLNRTLDRLLGLSAANRNLRAAYQSDGLGPRLPTGSIDVVTCPPLGAGQMLLLPGGDLLAGTGGMGDFGVEQVDAASLLGLPLGSGEPVPERLPHASRAIDDGILILNPIENGGPINFVAGGRSYSLRAEDRQHFPEGEFVIEFPRSRGGERVRYTLTSGSYAFRASDNDWNLVRQPFRVTIDNRANQSTFHYQLNGVDEQLPAGQLASHRSEYPIVLRFDRSGGTETTKELIDREASLVVAVNPRDGLWDLYAAASFPQIENSELSTRANSLAQEALAEELNRLGGSGGPTRFNTMKPVLGESNSAGRSWDRSGASIEPTALPSYLREADDSNDLLPEPAPN